MLNITETDETSGKNTDTFPCPSCGTKVLDNTKYCVKCKKKVVPSGEKKAPSEDKKDEEIKKENTDESIIAREAIENQVVNRLIRELDSSIITESEEDFDLFDLDNED